MGVQWVVGVVSKRGLSWQVWWGVRVFSRLLSLFGIWKVVGGRQKGRREKGEGRRDGGGAIPVGSNVGP